jgi:hypothetical protein
MALKPPREILWKWLLRYLITEMRLETSERPSSWWLPWGHLSNFQTGWTTMHDSRGCFKCNQTRYCAKNCISPHLPPGPCPQCGQNGHWKDNCPLCLCKVDQSPIPTLSRVKASWTSWAWWQKTDVALGHWSPSRSAWRSRG